MSKKPKESKRPYYTGVILRLYDKTLEPDKITKKLDIQPASCWKRGYEVIGKSGKKRFNPYGQWNLRPLTKNNSTLQTKIEKLWHQIEPKKKELRSILKGIGAELCIYVNPGDQGYIWWTLKSGPLNNFTSLGIDIQLSVHNF